MGSPLPLPEQPKSKKTPTQASFFVEQFYIDHTPLTPRISVRI